MGQLHRRAAKQGAGRVMPGLADPDQVGLLLICDAEHVAGRIAHQQVHPEGHACVW
jgi:hypothetical protein